MRTSTRLSQVIPRPLVRGVIRRRLLVNAVVDPDEAAARLPVGLRPHVTDLGTVVGCCLLEITDVRPAPVPAVVGINLRAAAHRFSVEWDDESGQPVVGVYVPVRLTDSRLAVALGGRWFPGVHRPAPIDIVDGPARFGWRVEDSDGGDAFGIRVAVSTSFAGMPAAAGDAVGRTCVGAAVGLSPDHRGVLEAVRMQPDHQSAHQVEIDDLHSDFLSGFTTATPAPAFLMQNVGVTWMPAPAPVPVRTRT
jgi:hypothetical protein